VIRKLAVAAIALHASTALAGRRCHEVDPVLGYRHCGGFGTRWAHGARTAWTYQLHAVVERIGLHVVSGSGASYSATSTTTYHAAVAPGSDLHPLAPGGRLQWGYLGERFSALLSTTFVFFGHQPVVMTPQDDGQLTTSHGGDVLDLAAALGVHDRIGVFGYGAEVAGGARFAWLSVGLPEGFTTCSGGFRGRNCTASLSDIRALVEPRVFVEYWPQREVSLRLTAGYAALGDGQTIALGIAFHLAPYDGT